MRRFNLICGWIVWTVACVAWSFFYGTPVQKVSQFSRYVEIERVYWAVNIWTYLSVMVVWYFINWINIIKEWERRPVLLFGKYQGTYGPGFVLIEPILHTILSDISVQDIVIEIGTKQQIQTKNNVGVFIEGVLTYCIDAALVRNAVVNVKHVHDAVGERSLSTLTDEGAKQELEGLLEHRDSFCKTIRDELGKRVSEWGVVIKAFELKSFKIADPELEKAIAMKARAEKEGQAEIVRAEMQYKIAQELNKAGDELNENGRYLKDREVFLEMTRSANLTTVVVPTDMMGIISAKALAKV